MDCFSCIDSSGARFLLRRFVASVGDILPDNKNYNAFTPKMFQKLGYMY